MKRWPLARALRCGLELARALRYCHDDAIANMRVLHRDIKPNNIGFLADGRLVLFDFGLASLWPRSGSAEDDAPRALTGETDSLRYMAPEVALNRPYNHKAEVFGFASVLWEMAAHVKPFATSSTENFLSALSQGARPAVPKKWPVPLHPLLRECWDADQAKRPEFSELVPRLEELHANLDTAAFAVEESPRSKSPVVAPHTGYQSISPTFLRSLGLHRSRSLPAKFARSRLKTTMIDCSRSGTNAATTTISVAHGGGSEY